MHGFGCLYDSGIDTVYIPDAVQLFAYLTEVSENFRRDNCKFSSPSAPQKTAMV